MNRLTLIACATLFAAACGSKSKPADTTGGGGDTGGGTAAPASWAEMNHEQKIDFMKTSVMPTMKAMFQEFAPDHYAEFGCDTCHGEGAADGSFEMPNPQLFPLTEAYFGAPPAEHQAVLQFMGEKVKPTMANLLGESEWSPENPEGFGCWSCHPAQ